MADVNDTLVVRLDGREVTLMMTFGLLDRLVGLMGPAQDLATVGLEDTLRGRIIREVLSKRGRAGVLEGEVDLDALDLGVDDAMRIVDWAVEHALDFFLRRLEAAARLGERYQAPRASWTSSSAGSPTSASPTPSAGPSTPSPAA